MTLAEHCSFCGASSDRSRALIAGPNHIYICDACVEMCRKTIDEADQGGARPFQDPPPELGRWLLSVREQLMAMLDTTARAQQSRPGAPPEAERALGVISHLLDRIDDNVRTTLQFTRRMTAGKNRPDLRPAPRNSPRRRGPDLEIITDLFVASDADVETLTDSPWITGLPTVELRGLVPPVLLRLVEVLSVPAVLEPFDQRDPSPHILTVPPPLQVALAGLPDDRFPDVAERWSAASEVRAHGWERTQVEWALRQMVALARRAGADGKSLRIWIDP